MVDMRCREYLPGSGIITERGPNLKGKSRVCDDDGIKTRAIKRQVEAYDFHSVCAHRVVRQVAIDEEVGSGTGSGIHEGQHLFCHQDH